MTKQSTPSMFAYCTKMLGKLLLVVIVGLCAAQLFLLLMYTLRSGYAHLLAPEADQAAIYGHGSWVVATGASSGQGKRFALELAERGFNLLLIGSKRSFDVRKEISERFPNVEVRVVLKDFCQAFEDGFFDTIEDALNLLPDGQVSGLINNVGHRVGYVDFARMPPELIKNTLACGTITQARITQLLLPLLNSSMRPQGLRSFCLSITAQNATPSIFLSTASPSAISTPYLGCYESTNIWGTSLALSLHEEAKLDKSNITDHLIIMPGATITSNTQFLKDTIGATSAEDLVKGSMRLLGRETGAWSGTAKQGLTLWLSCLCPPIKQWVLNRTGRMIATELMKRDQTIARKVV
jgi:17beta-estradiol 17-dehydrogenase / very-long-chain 3-oxoacyl-CoA reductase